VGGETVFDVYTMVSGKREVLTNLPMFVTGKKIVGADIDFGILRHAFIHLPAWIFSMLWTTASPICDVPVAGLPSTWMSAVRMPLSKVVRTAFSMS